MRVSAPQRLRQRGEELMRDYEEHRRAGAATRSFTTPAIITLVLYFVLWIPGFIANIVYWREANNVQKVTGYAPEGKDCLVALLWVFVVLPIVGGIVIFVATD
jgi:hypothetical protein